MNKVAEFFDRPSDRFGPSGILPHHLDRAERLRRLVGEPPLRILELGCGSGGTTAACAQMGYAVTAIELSTKRAAFAANLARDEGLDNLTNHNGDFYTADLAGDYDAVAYWNGFGVGTDADQRQLLHRVADECLTHGGLMLVDIFSPSWWAKLPSEIKRHEEYDAWQQTTYDFSQARFVDRWWSRPDESDVSEQSVRCYSPPDLELLLEGTGLRIEAIETGDPEPHENYSYLAILRREK